MHAVSSNGDRSGPRHRTVRARYAPAVAGLVGGGLLYWIVGDNVGTFVLVLGVIAAVMIVAAVVWLLIDTPRIRRMEADLDLFEANQRDGSVDPHEGSGGA